MKFEELKLSLPILRALEVEGYQSPTPIQERAIPVVLERKDLLGCAQTGTGKTAAFAVPILQILTNPVRNETGRKAIKALIVTPTRELAIQIGESFGAYGQFLHMRHTVVYGGVSQFNQTRALRSGIDILIATPGRLFDLMNQGFIHLDKIEIFVLDEADRMLDMGFLPDVKKIVSKLPAKKQTLFFSATMPPEIAKLANMILVNPVKVEIESKSPTVDLVKQAVFHVDKANKLPLLIHLLQDERIESALVFTRTKYGADRVAKRINDTGIIAEAIHGDKTQNARQKTLSNFKTKRTRVMVATDVAARGLDIDDLSHVINFDLPEVPETYVHRIGRTARAGAVGMALSLVDHTERGSLRDITRLIKKTIPVVENHPFMLGTPVPSTEYRHEPKPIAQTPQNKRYNQNNRPFHVVNGNDRKGYRGRRAG